MHLSALCRPAQCDTLHALIKEYRDTRKILLNVEHRLMVQMAPNYDALPVLNKLEVFLHSLENTTGHDLASVLWLRSRNAEHWLLRRTTYTRSLAVMSMVGYILGLGDRHPSNLMLDRLTGKILHIDFGDCFEVAVHRDKFPEKIPFRLTRMLVNAMEVSGIEGNFRSTCEAVMGMLRNNKDSVIAMLEAFVHDPLINWRLLVRPSQASTGDRAETSLHRSRSASGVSRRRTSEEGTNRADGTVFRSRFFSINGPLDELEPPWTLTPTLTLTLPLPLYAGLLDELEPPLAQPLAIPAAGAGVPSAAVAARSGSVARSTQAPSDEGQPSPWPQP